MKKILALSFVAAMFATPMAYASNVDFGVNINIGNTPNVVVPAPVVAPPPPVVIDEPPEFIEPPQLGFYVAVGVPYDLVFMSNHYYMCRNNVWFRAPSYNGPWATVGYRSLPPGLRRYKIDRIRYIRDEEYRPYRARGAYYPGEHFRPAKEWRERREEAHERWKDEDRWDNEGRGHGRGHGRHWDDD